MKKIIPILLVILSSYVVNGQSISNRAFPNNTVRDWRFMAGYNLYVPRYNDTTQANIALNLGIDSCGAQIFTYNVNAMWYRQCSPKKWVLLSNGNAPVYTADRGVKIITGDVIRLTDTVEGAGTKFQYLYDKGGAFRVGLAVGTEWNVANIGYGSFAANAANTASASYSTAFGQTTQASGTGAFSAGISTISSNTGSASFGNSNTASGQNSFAIGLSTLASGTISTSLGNFTKAVGNASMATGVGTYMNTLNGVVFGAFNDTTNYYLNNVSTQVATDPIFAIGNGSGVGVRANAFEMLRNGATKFSSGITTTTDTTTFKPVVMDASGNLRKVSAWNIGAWRLNGNAGTIDSTNFIGTTDNVPFNIRVNNQKAGRIDPTLLNAFYGYQSGNTNTTGFYNTAIGSGALRLNTTGYNNVAIGYESLRSNTTALNNVAIGYQTLYSNTTSINNTAIGKYALYSDTTGGHNTVVGVEAMYNNTSGTYNVAMGETALSQTTNGSYNVGIGHRALYTNTSGSNNTALGKDADVSQVDLINATAIGANAYVADSNSIVLGAINGINGATVDTKVGVGTTTPSERLDVVGNLKLTGKFITPSGANAIAGIATLSTGSVTVNTNKVATNSVIFLTRNTPSGTLGELSVPSASIVDGVSFTINSSSATETSTVNWFIINQ
jgi:hypothetical protein